jgi:crotonobetainyl-CoA:carnitine CoA-transferase CaiB-like acyl-CoA transferase
MLVGSSYADVVAGVHAFAGLVMSLYHRERTGRGGHILTLPWSMHCSTGTN